MGLLLKMYDQISYSTVNFCRNDLQNTIMPTNLTIQLSFKDNEKKNMSHLVEKTTKMALSSQGINQSANFPFLQRLSIILGFHRACPRSLASCRDYHPQKMAESVHVILLPTESLGRKLNHSDSLCRKQKLADSLKPCGFSMLLANLCQEVPNSLLPTVRKIYFDGFTIYMYAHGCHLRVCMATTSKVP